MSIDTLEEAARLWEEALKATSEQTANKNAAQTDGGTKFSIKRTSQMTLAQQLKMFYDGKMASSDAFYFGVTPAALEKSGFEDVYKRQPETCKKIWTSCWGSFKRA